MRSLSLWQIKPDSEGKPKACEILEKLILVADYKDYCSVIGRLLQHFPSRQVEKDAVIISDLSGDCIEEGVSLCALMHICNAVRKEASNEKPFLPPTGEILERSVEKTKFWQQRLESLLNPKPLISNKPAMQKTPSIQPWACKDWNDYDEADKNGLQKHLKTMLPEKREGYKKYLMGMCKVPPSFFSF